MPNKPISLNKASKLFPAMPSVQEMGWRSTQLGTAQYIRIYTVDYRPLGWEEVWEAFAQAYPGHWAVEVYPPADQLVNEQNIYHLFVLEGEPVGLNIRRR
jgi:hypothetical protein